jgi:hypothetical protein
MVLYASALRSMLFSVSAPLCVCLMIFNHGGHGVSRRKKQKKIKTPCTSVYSVVFYSYDNVHGIRSHTTEILRELDNKKNHRNERNDYD